MGEYFNLIETDNHSYSMQLLPPEVIAQNSGLQFQLNTIIAKAFGGYSGNDGDFRYRDTALEAGIPEPHLDARWVVIRDELQEIVFVSVLGLCKQGAAEGNDIELITGDTQASRSTIRLGSVAVPLQYARRNIPVNVAIPALANTAIPAFIREMSSRYAGLFADNAYLSASFLSPQFRERCITAFARHAPVFEQLPQHALAYKPQKARISYHHMGSGGDNYGNIAISGSFYNGQEDTRAQQKLYRVIPYPHDAKQRAEQIALGKTVIAQIEELVHGTPRIKLPDWEDWVIYDVDLSQHLGTKGLLDFIAGLEAMGIKFIPWNSTKLDSTSTFWRLRLNK